MKTELQAGDGRIVETIRGVPGGYWLSEIRLGVRILDYVRLNQSGNIQ